jgi:hypothetical protein
MTGRILPALSTSVEIGPPQRRGERCDHTLAGRAAVVDTIEQELDGDLYVCVTLEDGLAAGIGGARRPCSGCPSASTRSS